MAAMPSKPSPANQGRPLPKPSAPPLSGTNSTSQPGASTNACTSTTKGQMTRGTNRGAR